MGSDSGGGVCERVGGLLLVDMECVCVVVVLGVWLFDWVFALGMGAIVNVPSI